MSTTTQQLEAMARKLLRAELAARGARDVDVAEAYLARITRFDPDIGDYVGTVDHSGTPLIAHKRDGAPYMNIEEVLAETMKAKPELFGGSSTAPGRVGQPPAGNPFRSDATGHGPNLTEIMLAYRKDPEEAEQMARDASFWSNIR